jgi:hypothetical protein
LNIAANHKEVGFSGFSVVWEWRPNYSEDRDGSFYLPIRMSLPDEYYAIYRFDVTESNINIRKVSLNERYVGELKFVSHDGVIRYNAEFSDRIVRKEGSIISLVMDYPIAFLDSDHYMKGNYSTSYVDENNTLVSHQYTKYNYDHNIIETYPSVDQLISGNSYRCNTYWNFRQFKDLLTNECGHIYHLSTNEWTSGFSNLVASSSSIIDIYMTNNELIILHDDGLSTQSIVSALDLSTNTTRTLIAPEQGYDIVAMAVSKNGLIEFTGFQLSDGRKILGRLNTTIASAAIEIVDIDIPSVEIQLISVN